MPKDNIRENLDGNNLDLSLNNMSVVPVKELSAIPKATNLDLSCNILTTLPDSFCELSHLIKLDLSKNQLVSLPYEFGNLVKLQHLDLLGNQLQHLPLSFSQLQRLKWLDLKDNPLEPALNEVAGDCLNESQCRKCAKSVLQFMITANDIAEKIKEKELKNQREKEAALRRQEEAEKMRKKAEKQAEKERRKREYEARKVQEKVETVSEEPEIPETEEKCPNGVQAEEVIEEAGGSCFRSCCFWFFTLFAVLVAVAVGCHFYCSQAETNNLCQTYYRPSTHYLAHNFHILTRYTSKLLISTFGKNVASDFLDKL